MTVILRNHKCYRRVKSVTSKTFQFLQFASMLYTFPLLYRCISIILRQVLNKKNVINEVFAAPNECIVCNPPLSLYQNTI